MKAFVEITLGVCLPEENEEFFFFGFFPALVMLVEGQTFFCLGFKLEP